MKTAPIAGKSWQPSHEPPCSKRNRHPSHCRNSGKREGKGVGGELPGQWAATLWNAREPLLYVRHVTLCYNPQARGIPTHAHVSTPLTSRGTQALFVVNFVKLHLTAFTLNYFTVIHQGCRKEEQRWIQECRKKDSEMGEAEYFILCRSVFSLFKSYNCKKNSLLLNVRW